MNITFITGNQGKADFLTKHIDHPIGHRKVDIEEIQSLDLKEIAEYKARQAYKVIGSPVLVEDVALVFEGLGGLPGPFIKWFEISLGLEKICQLVNSLSSSNATAKVCFVYFDGESPVFFEGQLTGSIVKQPRGNNGFGFDPIFVPNGSTLTLAEMDDEELEHKSLRTTTVYPQLKEFLSTLDM
jgi:non-canonical purine NTP pyrophosphatase (RdgB/HAM1 family)